MSRYWDAMPNKGSPASWISAARFGRPTIGCVRPPVGRCRVLERFQSSTSAAQSPPWGCLPHNATNGSASRRGEGSRGRPQRMSDNTMNESPGFLKTRRWSLATSGSWHPMAPKNQWLVRDARRDRSNPNRSSRFRLYPQALNTLTWYQALAGVLLESERRVFGQKAACYRILSTGSDSPDCGSACPYGGSVTF